MGECKCGSAPKLVFSCSGAADVGAIADMAARKVNAEGSGKMFCTAGIGGRVSGIMKTTEGAAKIIALDGCSLDCVKLSLENAGFSDFKQVRVTDMGMEKGKADVCDENVWKVAQAVCNALEC